MDDIDIIHRIGTLADEEQHLEGAHVGTPLSGAELERLESINVALDQCWDLLNQRRARRIAGQDPDEATLRAEEVVEHYRQ